MISVPPDLPLPDAAQLLFSNKVGCLPVVDQQNKLLGIITEHDLAKLALSLLPAG